jgi:hypothetical protein
VGLQPIAKRTGFPARPGAPLRIVAAMIQKTIQCAGIVLLLGGICGAQRSTVEMPESLVIARHTFFDFGPPFDFYDVIRVKGDDGGLSVEQALVTPPGLACVLQPAKIEFETGKLHETLTELLAGKNPCAIPEKDLHREIKRCRHCLNFSGVNVTMEVSCGGKLRQLRMDILGSDLFDPSPRTPENTSWTMGLLREIDKTLSPGPMDKPMFALSDPGAKEVPHTELVRTIEEGQYDALFGKDQTLSQIVHQAEMLPPPPPSVSIESVTPFEPISPKIPLYPPIAKAAQVEGLVNLTFDISREGKVQNIALVDGPKLVELGITDAVSGWSFLSQHGAAVVPRRFDFV